MHRFLAVILALCLATGAWAEITGVTPTRGSLGISLTISGTGFGTKRPRVVLNQALTPPGSKARKITLKVAKGHTDTQIVAQIPSGVLGIYNLSVTPVGKGAPVMTRANAFDLVIPSIGSLNPATGTPNSEVTFNGQFFGTKKGFVLLGGQKAKIVSWTDTLITFKVPTKLANGTYDMEVRNKLGSRTRAEAYRLTGSSVGIAKKPVFKAKVNGKSFTVAGKTLTGVYTEVIRRLDINAIKVVGRGGIQQFTFFGLPVDLTELPLTLNRGTGNMLITYSDTPPFKLGAPLPRTKFYRSDRPGASFTLNLSAYDGTKLAGNFTATLVETSSGERLQVTSGTFTVNLVK